MSLASETLTQFKTLIKGNRLTRDEQRILAAVAADAASLQVQVMSGAITPAKAARERKQLDAQLSSIRSIGGARAQKVFWQAFDLAFTALFLAAT